jgi:lysophospholipase L1-like esterase
MAAREINGSVTAGDNVGLVSGTIAADLSQPARAPDGSWVVARVLGTIANGVVSSLSLEPNDTLAPAGTYWSVRIDGTTADGKRYVSPVPERWSVVSGTSPIAIGNVLRLNVSPPVVYGPDPQTLAARDAAAASAAGASTAGAAAGTTAGTTAGAAAAQPYATAASGSATAAASSASAASTSATAAQTARTGSEAARDAAQSTGHVYDTTAAGLAAEVEGAYFWVPASAAWDSLVLYRKTGGAAVEQKRMPTTARVDQVGTVEQYPDYQWVVTDAGRRVAIGVRNDGSLYVAKALQDITKIGGVTLDASKAQTGRLFALTDAAGRVSVEIADDGTLSGKIVSNEVVAARGTRADLSTRLGLSLSPYGYSTGYVYGEHYLRETRLRLRKRALGEAQQLVVAAIGDSWTQYYDRYCRPLWLGLKAVAGDAGPGFVGFGTYSGLLSGANRSVDGATVYADSPAWANWAYSGAGLYNGSPSPDICAISSAVVGARITVYGGPASSSAARLFFIGTGGAIQYRWNAGAWTQLTLAGTGLQTALLAGIPAGAWTLDIDVVSGTAHLCGLDIQKTTDGVRFHKLGGSGSRATHWLGVDSTQWQGGIAMLAPNLVSICLGTNDQTTDAKVTYKANISALIDRVRAAVPAADVLLIAPCENGAGRTVPMSDYQAAMFELAVDKKCAAINLQHVFGEVPADYAAGSLRPWFNADTIHPEPATGGRVIADALTRLLVNL